ncbi:hypothetical protein CMI47_18045 [Candidatus Pacearchaeota archaeon]|jgi:hypothetical protein|nr:hypothetical protein [Candidatus Pacearchaeota archaeon]|tara:strand:+ start:542 stop:793 length:252 start_codon:yes stop_codon:yes gene_type:complete
MGYSYIKWTCCGCGDEYTEQTGDTDERMCDDCLDYESETDLTTKITKDPVIKTTGKIFNKTEKNFLSGMAKKMNLPPVEFDDE